MSVDAVVRLQAIAPVMAHDDQIVGLLDRLALTLDQRGRREVVHVMHRAHDAYRRSGVADPGGGARRDAVLGVEDVDVLGQLGQPGLEVVDRIEDPLLQRWRPWRGGDERVRRADRPEEALTLRRQGDDAYV